MKVLSVTIVLTLRMFILAACGAVLDEASCPEGSERYDEYRLFFGRNVGEAEGVSDEDWQVFLADTVTPRFPDGLSVFDAAGRGETRRARLCVSVRRWF